MSVIRAPLTRQIVALGLALGVAALALAYPLRGYLQQRDAEARAVAELAELEDQVADRLAQVAAFDDPAYIRLEAKRRLQYVMPGDTVYVIKVPGAATQPDPVDDPGILGEAPGPDGAGASYPDDGPASWYDTLWGTLTGVDETAGTG